MSKPPEPPVGATPPPSRSPGKALPLPITINGEAFFHDGDPAMPLLWFLRDKLRLTGTKYGCGTGECGACTVLVDGGATRACVTPMSTAASHAITTIEGLAGEELHPVQQAWIDEDAVQCGYCQAGQIMAAAALLDKTPKPTDQDINTAMSGNLCRCGTYLRIRQAIHRAAEIGSTPCKTAQNIR